MYIRTFCSHLLMPSPTPRLVRSRRPLMKTHVYTRAQRTQKTHTHSNAHAARAQLEIYLHNTHGIHARNTHKCIHTFALDTFLRHASGTKHTNLNIDSRARERARSIFIITLHKTAHDLPYSFRIQIVPHIHH